MKKTIILMTAFLAVVGARFDVVAETRTSARLIEEVVVTARRREESAQSVPVAVSAFNAAELQWMGTEGLQDIKFLAPNLNISDQSRGAGDAIVNIRGQSNTDVTIFFDPAVGLYFDNVYIARPQGALLNMIDVESVQVLRGLQGTLFGRNNIGGSIVVGMKKPVYENEFAVGVKAGNEGQVGGHFIGNIPLSADELALRVSYETSERDGFVTSLTTGNNDFNDKKEQSWRAALLWEPSENLEILMQTFGNNRKSTGRGFIDFLTPGLPEYTNEAGQTVLESDTFANTTSVNVKWDVNDVTVTAIAAYRELDNDNCEDADGTAWTGIDGCLPNDSEQKSIEVRVEGAALDSRLNWLTGAMWFQEEGNSIVNTADFVLRSPSVAENKSVAAFAHLVYDLTDQMEVAAGVRYTRDSREVGLRRELFLGSTVNDPAPGPAICNISPALLVDPAVCFVSRDEDFGYWSWEASLNYQLSSDAMAYVRLGKGQKSGGFSGSSSQEVQLEPFDPEVVEEIEIGVKSEWFDRRLRLNAALFYSEKEDYQLNQVIIVPGVGPVTNVTNAADAEFTGAEIELIAYPVENLMVTASYGYLDAEFIDFINGGVDQSDNEIPLTPEFSYSMSVRYEIPMDNYRLGAQVNWYYQDDIEFLVPNNTIFRQDGYGLLGGRIALTKNDDSFEVAAFVSNATDEYYFVSGSNYVRTLSGVVGLPRLYGVEASYNF